MGDSLEIAFFQSLLAILKSDELLSEATKNYTGGSTDTRYQISQLQIEYFASDNHRTRLYAAVAQAYINALENKTTYEPNEILDIFTSFKLTLADILSHRNKINSDNPFPDVCKLLEQQIQAMQVPKQAENPFGFWTTAAVVGLSAAAIYVLSK